MPPSINEYEEDVPKPSFSQQLQRDSHPAQPPASRTQWGQLQQLRTNACAWRPSSSVALSSQLISKLPGQFIGHKLVIINT